MQKYKSKILTLVAVAVGSSFFTLLIVLGATVLSAQQHQYTGNEDHVVTLDQAVKFVQNFSSNPTTPDIKGGYFGKNIFDKILSQSGCVGIRYYYAKTDAGVATLVLVGVDASGNDLTQGVLGEQIIPCPPFCPAPNPLYK
jgi:hypothetical protein